MVVSPEHMLGITMRHVEQNAIVGDYMEFGVFRGKSFIWAYRAAIARRLDQMFLWAFDSFRGLPEVGDDAGEQREIDDFYHGRYACSVDDFKNELHNAQLDLARVKIIEGWYNETLVESERDKWGVSQAAVVWVDCDLYESAKLVLEFVVPYLQVGTVLCFDDWLCFDGDPRQGEQRACSEWLVAHPEIGLSEFYRFGKRGKSFVVSRAASAFQGGNSDVC
ncbi:hypothetical protein LCGC14_0336210 [marine sediment metagenome]|uniref:Methyltransferase n=1 Tax=marine sediment metagenome TaxID=412755 RepID=A0A0F9W291_9ZZZZ